MSSGSAQHIADPGAPGCLPRLRFFASSRSAARRCLRGGFRPGASSPDGGIEEFPLLREMIRSSRATCSRSWPTCSCRTADCARSRAASSRSSPRLATCAPSAASSSSRAAQLAQPGAGGGIPDTRHDHPEPALSNQGNTPSRPAKPPPTRHTPPIVTQPSHATDGLNVYVPAGQGVLAVLDGQQRLTALNIAVYGSLAVKKKYAWWSSTDAFPKKRLYLNLLADADPDDLGLRYDLRFLTDEEAKAAPGEPDGWYPLTQVMTVANPGPAMFAEVAARGITDTAQATAAYQRLYDLYEAFRTARPINYYLETDQDPDKVLDIFVRVNSGGTTLSYSDLLLSMATNQWQHRDAREEVRALVQQLNTGGPREFSFSKDIVLKTALLIADVDVRFRVSNFTQDNMKKVEAAWDQTRDSLLRAATLLDMFGFSSRTLTADSVRRAARLLPAPSGPGRRLPSLHGRCRRPAWRSRTG